MARCVWNPGAVRITGYEVVRAVLALLLLVAAGLKGYQLATEPVLGTGLLDSRWFLIGIVECELFFGLWLLAGLLPRLTWLASLGCFGLFACVSLFKAVSGEASCGCFGRVEVNPWYTLTLDMAAVLALLRWRASGVTVSALVPARAFAPRGVVVMLAWLTIGLPGAVAMGTYQPAVLAEDGIILGDDNLVILEPEKWIGKRFPLLDYIDIGDRLKVGNWLIVLYHYRCPACREALSQYEQLAGDLATQKDGPRVALIEMPPYIPVGESLVRRGSCVRGRLDDSKKWFMEAPVETAIREGTVTKVRGREQLASEPPDTRLFALTANVDKI